MIESLTSALDRASVGYQVLPHPRSETAMGEARALAVGLEDVAKTVVVKAPGGNVRAVLLASERLDLHRLADHLDVAAGRVRLATEDELTDEYPAFEVGAVPPIGGPKVDAVVVDRRVAERDAVIFEAGSHTESVRVAAADLLRATGASVARIELLD